MTQENPYSINSLLKGILYGIIASVINVYLQYQVYGNMAFHFGEIAVFLCLINCGFRAALIASLLSSLSLFLFFDNHIFFILMGLELVFVCMLINKGYLALVADILYWIIIGMPLTYFFLQVYSTSFNYDSWLLITKQAINGLLYVAIAYIIAPFLPKKIFSNSSQNKLPKLQQKLFGFFSNITTITTLTLGLILTQQTVKINELQKVQNIKTRSEFISKEIYDYVNQSQSTLEKSALKVTFNPNSFRNSDFLKSIIDQNPGFITMLISDEKGNVIYGAPETKFKKMLMLPQEKRNIKDRKYFYQAIHSNKTYISDVFQGRGFGNDVIVAISSPYFVDEQFAGIIEGSLNLTALKFVDIDNVNLNINSQHQTIILDQNNNIIYASESLHLKALSNFKYTKPVSRYAAYIPMLQMQQDGIRQDYFFYQHKTINNWKVFLLESPEHLNRIVMDYHIKLISFFSIIFMASLLFSRYSSKLISKPIDLIVADLRNLDVNNKFSKDIHATQETYLLNKSINYYKGKALKYQENLKHDVAERTHELSEMNELLEKYASEDSLTGLKNRRIFDETLINNIKSNSRSHNYLCLAILDIDNFKRVNDRWGHPAGDGVIRQVASQIKKAFKRTDDLVARVGGEEFGVIFQMDDDKKIIQILEKLRKDIEKNPYIENNLNISVTVSIGAIKKIPDPKEKSQTIYSIADQLLYKSKKEGKNRIHFESV